MSEFIPKPGTIKIGGLSRKAAKLEALKEKAAHINSGGKPAPGASMSSFKAKDSFAATKKSNFQRKAT
jgi:hypothetical protein